MTSPFSQLGASVVAIATPFCGKRIDAEALASLCERQIDRGTRGIVVCGSTGEAPSLTLAEHERTVRTAAEAVCGRVPLIAGASAMATEAAAELAAAAARGGADALLCAAPPYCKPTQEGIFAHIRVVAHAASLPVMLYDVPGRVGVPIADETIARLFAAELIGAIKDASGDLTRPPRLRALCGCLLAQYTGEDGTAAAYRAMGGAGCVSVTANLAPALCASLHEAWGSGDHERFARIRDLLAPLHAALFVESNPIPLKAALEMLNLCSGSVRLPLPRAAAATLARLARLLPSIMVAEEREARRSHHAPAKLRLLEPVPSGL